MRRPTSPLLLLVLLLASAPWIAAGQQRDPAAYAKLLEGAERVARMQVPRVIGSLELRAGMKVADLGSGSGLFTRPIAQAIAPAGVVFAVDIDRGLLDIVERSAREVGIANVRAVLAAADDPKLPEPVDLVFLCDTLHHIGSQATYLRTLAKYVKPGGRVAVIDFGERWPDGHESMRYSATDLEGWMKSAGFTRIAAHDYLENAFFVVYRRN